jgi:hypothetical protein
MVASSKLAISHQSNDGRRRVDGGGDWRVAWWNASQEAESCCQVGRAVRAAVAEEGTSGMRGY